MIKKSEATADDHPKLTVIEGGKAEPIPKSGGGSTPPTDYVSEMTVGTTFLARPRKVNTFVLIEFSVTDVGQNSVELFSDMWYVVTGDRETEKHWCAPVEFCMAFELHDILREGPKE